MKYDLNQFKDMDTSTFKVKVYQYNEPIPYAIHYITGVGEAVKLFNCWEDYVTEETLFRVFLVNKQTSFEKLYLSREGDILTRIVYTKEK